MITQKNTMVIMICAFLFLTGCSINPVDGNSSINTASNPATAKVDELNEMYYGFRTDIDGSECGGICWDFYTFLPRNKVLIGLPTDGGPEKVDCKKDECLEYTVNNNELQLSNGESLEYNKTSDDKLIINKTTLNAVKPVPQETTLNNQYIYMGFFGLIGISAGASSWTYYLTLNPDETFELSGLSLASLGANSGTSSHTSHDGDSDIGTYNIENNTITMTAIDGTIKELLFFLHDDDINDIQIGRLNYYVDE